MEIPGRVLAAARVLAGLRMVDLAELCGTSTRTLVKLEAKSLVVIGSYGEAGHHRGDTVDRVIGALHRAGVRVDEDGRGVRLAWGAE